MVSFRASDLCRLHSRILTLITYLSMGSLLMQQDALDINKFQVWEDSEDFFGAMDIDFVLVCVLTTHSYSGMWASSANAYVVLV